MDKQNLFSNDGITMSYGVGIHGNELFSPSWDNPADQNDPFRSALSSMVSSPAASHAGGANHSVRNQVFILKELIGRLGSFDNSSGEFSPAACTNNSGYNSPPKLNLSSMVDHPTMAADFPIHPDLPQQFSTDPGFADRAARFSCFSGKLSGNLSIKKSTPESSELGNSRENSTVSDQIPVGEICKKDTNLRKRKASTKGKAKETTTTSSPNAAASGNNDFNNPKRTKLEEQNNGKENKANNPKAAESVKDYIHVRARRGQATDAHSLAERVRREKISERMKLLQDLVPGCNKVTGKAVMLDEIINYVQSLQRQVEFLSMKLATVNPRMEFDMEALLSKDVYEYQGTMSQNVFSSPNASGTPIPYSFQSQHSLPTLQSVHCKGSEAPFCRNQDLTLPHMDTYLDPSSQVPVFFEDDLSSVVHMGFGQNQTQNFHGTLSTSEMKAEL